MKSSDNSIPPEIWASMPQELLDRIITTRKEGAKITYHKNAPGGFFSEKTYDEVEITIKLHRNSNPWFSCYNAKNGIMTKSGTFGVLSGGCFFYDPETGEPAGV